MQRRKTKEDDNLIADEQDLQEAGYGSLKTSEDYIYEFITLGPEKVSKQTTYESFADTYGQNIEDAKGGRQPMSYPEVPRVRKNSLSFLGLRKNWLLGHIFSRQGWESSGLGPKSAL